MKNAGIAAVAVLSVSLATGSSCAPEKPGQAPTLKEAGAAEYRGIYDSPVRLAEGRYEGEPFVEGGASRPSVELSGNLFLRGDLDGDGCDEAVALLVENSGGAGSFVYVAVLARRGEAVENIDTSPVGDRVQVRNIEIDDRKIFIDAIQHGPGDAMCCPSHKARRSWQLDGNDLVEGLPVLSGKISIMDLAGVEWVLLHLGRDPSYPGETPVTLVFEDGRIAGSSGCNRYFAEITEISPGVIEIGEMGTTRMACSNELMVFENWYLAELDGVVRYGFIAGRLALTCETADGSTTMVFNAAADSIISLQH